ncbi:2-keto-4-pentenoate hydratase [Actinocorallia sp. A-T 12471]|uniref:2-keto-4-pentenoate hydratase n=1 Tax=Actinocorallia sp. A-T 12471 TaxID=3089813 RepID=UPI0029CB1E44|nr:fumarylacetoacetate hydrolase family protein [Actinocorallia sp. A-T 12471]MDX6742768.1 4-oxalocrotonate decarboxylase [Actinocorallia sp. A-T 12471]
MTGTTDGLAGVLAKAERDGVAVSRPEGLDVDGAYAVQSALLAARVAQGERLVGVKLGFTSLAKMAQMGVDEIIVGFLTDAHEVADGGELFTSGLIHPRVEPEVAFRLDRDVDAAKEGPEGLLAAVGAVAPALEVIDSRYANFRFSLPDVIADNTSACRFAVGPWSPIPDGLAALDVALLLDDEVVASGSTGAILGDPLEALRRLPALAARYGHPLKAGTVILAGAATEAVPLPTGTRVTVKVAGLGEASLHTAPSNAEGVSA